MRNECYEATVDKIIAEGKHGPYAVARSEELGSITFSLDPEVWREESWPEPGICVLLSNVFKKLAGWRAGCDRFVRPSDITSKK